VIFSFRQIGFFLTMTFSTIFEFLNLHLSNLMITTSSRLIPSFSATTIDDRQFVQKLDRLRVEIEDSKRQRASLSKGPVALPFHFPAFETPPSPIMTSSPLNHNRIGAFLLLPPRPPSPWRQEVQHASSSSRTAEHIPLAKQAMAYFDAGSIPFTIPDLRRHVEERWLYRTRRGRAYQGNIKPV
jgi:hypothetical protein